MSGAPATSGGSSGGYRFILSRRWLGYIALAIVAAIVCVFLANWQDHRRAARDAEIERIEANYHGEVRDLAAVVDDPAAPLPESAEWARVRAVGTYDTGSTVLARNRSLQNQAGFYVVVPFDLASGGSIAVVRGWVPTTSEGGPPAIDALPAPPAGEVEIEMWLRPAQDSSEDTNAPGLIRAIDPAVIPGMDAPYTGTYGQLAAESPPPADAALTELPPPSTDPGSHLSYTFQWLAFAVMILIGVIYAARREKRALEAARAERTGEAPAPEYVVVDKDALTRRPASRPARRPVPRPARRRNRTSEEELEDALLDSQGY